MCLHNCQANDSIHKQPNTPPHNSTYNLTLLCESTQPSTRKLQLQNPQPPIPYTWPAPNSQHTYLLAKLSPTLKATTPFQVKKPTKHDKTPPKQGKTRQKTTKYATEKTPNTTALPKTASNQPYHPHLNPICNVHIHVKLEHSAIFHQTKHKNSHIKNNFLSHTKTQKHTFTQPNPQNGNQALCCITTGKQNQTPKCNVQF